MTPELTEDEMRLLHKEAMELYDTYLKADAKHKVDVDLHIANDIYASKFYYFNELDWGPCKVEGKTYTVNKI